MSKITNQDSSQHLSDRELLLDIKHSIANKLTGIQVTAIIGSILGLISMVILIVLMSRMSWLFFYY